MLVKNILVVFCALLSLCAIVARANPVINWGACQGINDNHYSCARLTVPLNYNNPHPGNTWIEVIKYQQSSSSTAPVLFLNGGGPWGAMTTGALPAVVNVLNISNPAILNQFTLVSFDPRGVGQSQNLTCNIPLNGKLLDINFASKEGLNQVLQLYGQISQQCSTQFNDFQSYMGTLNTAQDMEQVRQALGVNTISYLGESYGTQLGALYLSLYPQHVRAMVLDSNVPPSRDYQYFVTQIAEASEETLNAFFRYCDANTHCPIYPSAAQSYDQAVTLLTKKPVPAGSLPPLTLAHFYAAVRGMLYSTSTDAASLSLDQWNVLAQGLHDITVNDDASLLETVFQEESQPVNDNYTTQTVICSDFTNHPDQAQTLQLAAYLRQETPRIGAYSGGFFLPMCTLFPNESQTLPALSYSANTPAVMLLGNDDDPATPLIFSEQMNQTIPNSRLITWMGPGHVIYLFNEMPGTCVKNQVDNYLLNLTLPNQSECDDVINPTSLLLGTVIPTTSHLSSWKVF